MSTNPDEILVAAESVASINSTITSFVAQMNDEVTNLVNRGKAVTGNDWQGLGGQSFDQKSAQWHGLINDIGDQLHQLARAVQDGGDQINAADQAAMKAVDGAF